jgi:hypothetical protein
LLRRRGGEGEYLRWRRKAINFINFLPFISFNAIGGNYVVETASLNNLEEAIYDAV